MPRCCRCPTSNRRRSGLLLGITWYPDDAQNYEALLKYADFAMYQIKNSSKGSIGEFSMQSYAKNSFLLQSKEDLNHLIDDRLVRYVFQPIVDAHTGEVFAYEALMRPQLPALSSPLDVLTLARSQSKLYQNRVFDPIQISGDICLLW